MVSGDSVVGGMLTGPKGYQTLGMLRVTQVKYGSSSSLPSADRRQTTSKQLNKDSVSERVVRVNVTDCLSKGNTCSFHQERHEKEIENRKSIESECCPGKS